MKAWLGVAASIALVTNVARSSSKPAASYTPQTRQFQMVTIQELIGEFANIPGLKDEIGNALKPGGPTGGNEVYAWDPNALTVYQGDTVNLSIHNGQGDEHIFVLADFGVSGTPIPGDKTANVTFTASKPGVYRFFCGIAAHQPWMQGYLTVLPGSAAG